MMWVLRCMVLEDLGRATVRASPRGLGFCLFLLYSYRSSLDRELLGK